MRGYRIYHVGDGGRLRLGEPFQAVDDLHAVEKAKLLRPPGEAAEIWESGRLVGRFTKAGAYAANGPGG